MHPMPEWLSGVLVGVLITAAAQWLQMLFRRIQYRHEKLLDRYAEFVAAASAELDRAKSLEAGLALGGREGDHSELIKLDDKRHESRQDLSRIAFQIRILEKDPVLIKKVLDLIKAQPFMAFAIPSRFGEGSYDERFDKYKLKSIEFEKLLMELMDTILKNHQTVRIWRA
jgi:hypothetical protein